jgi:hypothetical protein
VPVVYSQAVDVRVRARFWLESAAAVAGTALFALTLVQREWIEVVFRVDPDRGSGALELAVAAVLLLFSAACAVLARGELRRATAT